MTRPYAVILIGTSAAIGGVLVIAAVRPGALATATTMRVSDFGGYWVATRVHLAGQVVQVHVTRVTIVTHAGNTYLCFLQIFVG